MGPEEFRWFIGIIGTAASAVGIAFWTIIKRSDTRYEKIIERHEKIIERLIESSVESAKANAELAGAQNALRTAIERLPELIRVRDGGRKG